MGGVAGLLGSPTPRTGRDERVSSSSYPEWEQTLQGHRNGFWAWRCGKPVHGEARFPRDLDTHWDHEPWSEECSERPSPRPSPGGRGRIVPAGFEGLGRVLAGTGRDGSDGWSSGMSPCGICDTLSLRERVGVREPVSTLAMAATERFMESPLFKNDLLTGHEPGIPGGETPPSTAGETPAATDDRFMESGAGAGAMLTGHEPGEAGGITMRSRSTMTRGGSEEGTFSKNLDTSWEHEPGTPGGTATGWATAVAEVWIRSNAGPVRRGSAESGRWDGGVDARKGVRLGVEG